MKKAMILVCLLLFGAGLTGAEDRGVTVQGKKDAQDASSEVLKTAYYALIIGNNAYLQLPKLNTAVSDAKEVNRVLSEKYGFKTKLLINATRKDILSTINDFRKKLNENDSFLIYYAGHGEYDKTADKGYWLPVDAAKDDPVDWIMAEDITSNIKRILAKHVLILSDSCYSGSLTRSTTSDLGKKGDRNAFLAKMRERPSRTLMASGGNEPVADAGGKGNHSVFASAILTALQDSDKKTFTAEELFHGRVKEIVAGKSDQVPEYNSIRNSGHEGGDFIFQVAQKGGVGQTAFDADSHQTPTQTDLVPVKPQQASDGEAYTSAVVNEEGNLAVQVALASGEGEIALDAGSYETPAPDPVLFKKAEAESEASADLEENAQAWIDLGNSLMDAQLWNEAADAFEKSLALEPSNANVLVDQGTCYRGMLKFDKAEENYRKAIKIDPTCANAYRNLGVVLVYDLHDTSQGIKEFKRYLELAPNTPDADAVRMSIQELSVDEQEEK